MAGYDAHLHPDALPDLAAAVARARAAGVDGWCAAGADPARWDEVERAARAIGAQLALGVHPWFAAGGSAAWQAIDGRPAPDAIGEIGLDRLHPGFEVDQPAALRAGLARARALNRPVILHCVRAHAELLAVLRRDGLPARGGLIHGWTADAPALRPFLALGLHVSFGAAILRSPRAMRAAVAAPAGQLLLESDAPFGAPEPAAVAEHAASLAAGRGLSVDVLLASTGENARRLLAAA